MNFKKNIKYRKMIDKLNIFDNKIQTAIPQTKVSNIVQTHLNSDNGRTKRVLIYGFDGARADSMQYIIPSKDESYKGYNCKSPYSAITYLKDCGGLYLSYAGGNKQEPFTLQETSTAQGWASVLTGKWGYENGVIKHTVKNDSCPTILLNSAKNGVSSCFYAIWPDHFTITYKNEIKYAKENNLPLKFKQFENEEDMQKSLKEAIYNDTKIIFAINEFPDYNGHKSGFDNDNSHYAAGVTNADRYAFELIETIKNRPEYKNEDWLILITSDHGGHGKMHGTQQETDRMTFIACNKKLL